MKSYSRKTKEEKKLVIKRIAAIIIKFLNGHSPKIRNALIPSMLTCLFLKPGFCQSHSVNFHTETRVLFYEETCFFRIIHCTK